MMIMMIGMMMIMKRDNEDDDDDDDWERFLFDLEGVASCPATLCPCTLRIHVHAHALSQPKAGQHALYTQPDPIHNARILRTQTHVRVLHQFRKSSMTSTCRMSVHFALSMLWALSLIM